MEGKYGRLFTEEDVTRIVRLCREEEITPGAGIRRCGDSLSFPADEPLFVLRGNDEATPRVMRAALGDGVRNGALPSDRALAGELAEIRAVEDWQRAHPDRVKAPD